MEPERPPVITFHELTPGTPRFVDALEPGDCCLFSRNSIYNQIIKVKTWSKYTHIEVVTRERGIVRMAASRNDRGCGLYAPDWHGLALVLRPDPRLGIFDQTEALAWFRNNRIDEQGYDWLGLLNFTYARYVGTENGKMFCSEFATRYLERGGFRMFGVRNDADTIAPRDFTVTVGAAEVWRDET